VNGHAAGFALACLLLIVAGLLYLEWLQQDELASLNSRVVELELARQRRTRKPKTEVTT